MDEDRKWRQSRVALGQPIIYKRQILIEKTKITRTPVGARLARESVMSANKNVEHDEPL